MSVMLRPERLTALGRGARRRPIGRGRRRRRRVPGRRPPASSCTWPTTATSSPTSPPGPTCRPFNPAPPSTSAGSPGRRSCCRAGRCGPAPPPTTSTPSKPRPTHDSPTHDQTVVRCQGTDATDRPPPTRKVPHDHPQPSSPNPFGGRAPLSRRQLITRAGVLGAAGISLPSLLAACGGGSDDDAAQSGSSPGTAGSGSSPGGGGGNSLYFENWPAYIDPTEDGADRHGRPVRRRHRRRHAVHRGVQRQQRVLRQDPAGRSATATRSTPTSSPRRRGWPAGSSRWAGSTSCRST